MKSLLKTVAPFFLSLAVIAGGLYAYSQRAHVPIQQSQSFGAFTPVGGSTYVLSGSGVVSTATTIPVTAFKTPDGRALTMAMFGTIGYAVLDPNSPSKIEDITFTGITQNANGSAILTGVSRGMDFVTPYSASSTLAQAHAGGSYLILSNTAGFYGQQFLFSNSAGSSTASLSFSNTAPPFYYPGPGAQTGCNAISTTSEFASVAYVNCTAVSGAPNATTVVKGISQLATAAQAALGTILGSTAASLVIPNSLATSTPGLNATTQIPVTIGGKIAQAFLDLTANFTWSGTHIFNGPVTFNSSVSGTGVSKFGGTGADGALAISSGTTTVSLGGATSVIKNYTSISITGTGHLAFSNPSPSGTVIILRSQGNVTITCSVFPCIDASQMGAASGTPGITTAQAGLNGSSTINIADSLVHYGAAAQTAGVPYANTYLYATTSIAIQLLHNYITTAGNGGGGGTAGSQATSGGAPGPGGIGGSGGGALIIEVGAALNFTTTNGITVAGGNGAAGTSGLINGGGTPSSGSGGGGGGGSGGSLTVLYNTLTANSGTVITSGGTGGTGASSQGGAAGTGGSGGGGGGGGGFMSNAGTAGITGGANAGSTGGNGGNGGNGGSGYSLFMLNTVF